jgi:hypothetical protein
MMLFDLSKALYILLQTAQHHCLCEMRRMRRKRKEEEEELAVIINDEEEEEERKKSSLLSLLLTALLSLSLSHRLSLCDREKIIYIQIC